ncbi:hypothetical protein BX600DRAFT_436087 [Xylariales sp. PMI_506]|nr:hypothetical protein BX600DRAFT_436087 [Xylariales sp. PMI_506]
MSGTNSKAVELDQRLSRRTSVRMSVHAGDDNDYDLQAVGVFDGFRPGAGAQNQIPLVPDGFRPGASAQNQIPLVPATTSTPPPAPSSSTPDQSKQRPSSIAKPPMPRESLSLRHDGGMGLIDRSGPTAGSSSNAGPSAIVRAESPYRGPSGPSFPYQMYTQDVRPTRTASMATTATVPVSERSYHGPSGPTHPYQMYPQNTTPGTDDDDESVAPAVIPVGFLGSTDNYQRRIGPEGEEIADMIGPDGHTEQLPPYTRYPDEAYQRKIAGIQTHDTGSSTSAGATIAPAVVRSENIPGAGGIGLATRNPEFGSTEDLHYGAVSPQSRQSMRSLQSEVSQYGINTAAGAVASEKPLKKWQIMAKKKVWGVVPCWALTLTIIIVVMLAAVLSAILATILHKPHGPPPNSGNGSNSYSNDTTPLSSVPTDLPALPSGSFALLLAQEPSASTCFNDSTQTQAWNCDTIFAQLTLNIAQLNNQPLTSQYAVEVDYNHSYTMDEHVYSYGMQPPSIQDAQMSLVSDLSEPTRGPAWNVLVIYDKTVIIPESALTYTSATPTATAANKQRRQARSSTGFPPPPKPSISYPPYPQGPPGPPFGPPPGGPPGPPPIFTGGPSGTGGFKRKGLATDGDKPWFCYWNGTILELSIYARQNSSEQSLVLSGNGSGDHSSSSTSSSALPYTTSGSTSSTVARNSARGLATSSTTSQTTSTSSAASVYDTNVPSADEFPVPVFPRVVKMEERRVSGAPAVQPYCRQFEVGLDGVPAQPVKDSSGNYIDVLIVENEPTDNFYGTSKTVKRSDIEQYLNHGIEARDGSSSSNGCGCSWIAT